MTTVSTSSTIRDVLNRKDVKPEPQPGAGANPEFITDELGQGHSRATREAARFTAMAGELVKSLPPIEPTLTEVKVPHLVFTTDKVWETRSHTLVGNVELKVSRATKFSGKPDYAEPSRQLAAFMQGEGKAWEAMRDDDLPGLLIAWANAVGPTPHEARYASQSLALAMAARAGIAVSTVNHLPF